MNEFKGTIIFKLVIVFQTFGNILTIFVELSDYGAILLDPPGRGSLWRHNISGAPVNYRDHRQNCGGVQSQWKNNNGKCGLCGDPWNKPRDHEFGGKYFTNHISSTYQKGSVINLTVFTNLNPSGWMEFRLLPYDTEISSISNNYSLHIGNSRTRRYRVRRSGYHVIPVRLPTDVECERCILQWKFHTGASWGCNDIDQTDCCYGCGTDQEEFYNCADVSITHGTGNNDQSFEQQHDEHLKFKRKQISPSSDLIRWWCLSQCEGEECSGPPCSGLSRHRRSSSICLAAGAWAGQANMDTWCQNNCATGYCPASHCRCQDVNPVTTTTSTTTTTQSTTSTTVPTTTETTTTTTEQTTTHAHSTITTTSQNEDAPGIVRVLVSRGCHYCKGRNDNTCEDLYCPGYNVADIKDTGTLTQKITELSNYFCTTCDTSDSICQRLFCSQDNIMVSFGLHTKCRLCQMTGDCQSYPECDQINGIETTTTTPVTTTQPTTTTAAINIVPSKKTCIAINYYSQIIGMNKWCQDNCGSSTDASCYPDVCQCSDPSMPLIQKLDTGDVTTCKAIGQVANIPGMDKWCTDNCPNNCPETYCSCSVKPVTQSPTTSQTTTKTTTNPPTTTSQTTTIKATTTPARVTTVEDIVSGTTSINTTPGVTILPPKTTTASKGIGGVDYYSINAMNGILCNICSSDPGLYRECSDLYCARYDNSVGDPSDKLNRALNYSPELFCGVKGKDSIFCEPAPMIRPFIQSSLCSACVYLTPNQNCHTYCSSS
ncbi:uncharacterized protein [Magallana gigas]|uniref:uncharacterized protein isoform X1 n=1 Tax=Magallana gigas TaxID=29159 RepID=UPI0033403B93